MKREAGGANPPPPIAALLLPSGGGRTSALAATVGTAAIVSSSNTAIMLKNPARSLVTARSAWRAPNPWLQTLSFHDLVARVALEYVPYLVGQLVGDQPLLLNGLPAHLQGLVHGFFVGPG